MTVTHPGPKGFAARRIPEIKQIGGVRSYAIEFDSGVLRFMREPVEKLGGPKRALERLQTLQKRGLDINAAWGDWHYFESADTYDIVQRSPIHMMAYANRHDWLEVLVAAGADIHVSCDNESTAIYYAVLHGCEDAFALLANAGARLKEIDGKEKTLLHVAAANGRVALCEILYQSGLALDAREKVHGDAPLHLAAALGQADACVKLLDLGCQIDIVNNNGETPLNLAAQFNQCNAAFRLIDHGASLEIRNHGGLTPLEAAEHSGYGDLASALRAYSASQKAVQSIRDGERLQQIKPL